MESTTSGITGNNITFGVWTLRRAFWRREVDGEVSGQVLVRETGQVSGQVTGQVAVQVLTFCGEPRRASEIQALVGLRHRETFVKNYLEPLLNKQWIERTIPDKPKSRLQRYRLTAQGLAWLEKAGKPGSRPRPSTQA